MHIIRWLSLASGIACGFITGINTSPCWEMWAVSASSAVMLCVILAVPLRFQAWLLFAAAFLYGYSSYSADDQKLNRQIFADKQEVIAEGEVYSIPGKYYSGWRCRLKVSAFRRAEWEWQKVSAFAEVRFSKLDVPPLAGDRIVIKGQVSFPGQKEPGMVRERQRLFYQGNSAVIRVRDEGCMIYTGWNYLYFPLRMIQLVREEMGFKINQNYPPRHADILQALLLGENLKDPLLRDAFVRSGTSHILSVSGFHTSIAAAIIFFIAVFFRLSPSAGVFWASLAILSYMILTGWGVAVQRAGMMAVFMWISWALGRPQPLTYWLAAALALLLWSDPKNLGSVSFQLSFLSMAGILLAAPHFKEGLKIGFGIDISLAAFFAAYPAVLFHFQSLCIAGIFTNLAAVPVFALILPFGYLSLLPFAGIVFRPLSQFLLESMLRLFEWTARQEWSAVIFPQPPIWALGGYYLSGAVLLWLLERRRPPLLYS